MMRVYISGGMTGWPDNNQEAFDKAAAALRANGYVVASPAEFDRELGVDLKSEDGFSSTDEEYEEFLERDLNMISRENFDAVVFIKGWMTSGGAGREGRKAISEGLQLYTWSPEDLLEPLTEREFFACSRTKRLRPEEIV